MAEAGNIPDYFNEPYWNVFQTLAWIGTGDRWLVSECSGSIKERGTHPEERQLLGGDKVWIDQPNTLSEAWLAGHFGRLHGSKGAEQLDQAENALYPPLQNGILQAFGLANDCGDPAAIPPIQWHSLRFDFPLGCLPVAKPEGCRESGTVWHGVIFERSGVMDLWPDPLGAPPDLTTQPGRGAREKLKFAPTTPRNKGGRKPKVDWRMVEEEVHRLMDHHGPFDRCDPEWDVQARLEEAILSWCAEVFKIDIDGSTVRRKLPGMLKSWRMRSE